MATASDRVAGALPTLAVGENQVRRIIAVVCGIEAGRAVASGRERRGADHPRARRCAKRPRADAVIAMGMGDENGLDPLAVNRGQQRREMRIVAGARIEDRDASATQNIRAGAVEGEGRGVRRHKAAHHRRNLGQSTLRRLARGNEKVRVRSRRRPSGALCFPLRDKPARRLVTIARLRQCCVAPLRAKSYRTFP